MLSAFGVEISTLFAEGLAARARAQILCLDVVAGIAFGVIVVDILLNRMPR
jgi:hypothetical protein